MPRTRRLLTTIGTIALAAAIVGTPALADARSPAAAAQSPQHPAPAPADAAPAPVAAVDAAGLPSRSSDTSAFTFDSFDAVYRLGRDANKHSTLRTTETLVAEFPTFDQNRGIIRAIPTDYDGHPTQIQVISVTDGTGTKRSFETGLDSNDNSFFDITIAVPKGQYVHGAQTYVITYTQRDVTKHFADTGDDEFYWDVNGVGWAQPFGEVSATVEPSAALSKALTGKVACYYGPQGSTSQCEVVKSDGLQVSQKTLGPHENVTVAVGFTSGTFAVASSNPFAYLGAAPIIGVILGALGWLIGLILPRTAWKAKGTGIVVAQYVPPADLDLLTAANIVAAPKRGFAASLVDFAVRGKIKLFERKTGFFGAEQFGFQQLSSEGLDDNEQSLLAALSFGSLAQPTDSTEADDGVTWLKKKDTTLGVFVQSQTKTVAQQVLDAKLRRKPPAWAWLIVLLVSGTGVALLAITGLHASNGGTATLGIFGAFVAGFLGLMSISSLNSARPLTRDGMLLRENLDGLKLFIQFAEADRLKMLQSVTGAERAAGPDGTQVVKIYEKLLPYAVLFSLEKEWASTLGKYYDQNPPGWYDGGNLGAFQVAAFASGISSFSSSASSSYSGSAGSSGFGGSGGGGGSGSGGGGGGGGGI